MSQSNYSLLWYLLSHLPNPSHILIHESQGGFVITDKKQITSNHNQYRFHLQSSLGTNLPFALTPLCQEKQKGKGSWTDPPEIAGDPPPQDFLQAPAGGRPVITLGIRAALQDTEKPKGARHDPDEIGSCWSYPVPENIKKSQDETQCSVAYF